MEEGAVSKIPPENVTALIKDKSQSRFVKTATMVSKLGSVARKLAFPGSPVSSIPLQPSPETAPLLPSPTVRPADAVARQSVSLAQLRAHRRRVNEQAEPESGSDTATAGSWSREGVDSSSSIDSESVSRIRTIAGDGGDDICGSPNRMHTHLLQLFNSQMLCDLKVVSHGRSYNIHKIALTTHSDRYMGVFTGSDPLDVTSPGPGAPGEIVLADEVPADVLEQVLEYLYTFHIALNDGNVEHVILTCEQLDLKTLQERCVHFLTQYDVNNVLLRLSVARRCRLQSLVRRMRHFAARHIEHTRRSDDFRQLHIDDVYGILSSNEAHARVSEYQLLRPGMLWLAGRSEEESFQRLLYAARILECVNLERVDPRRIAKQLDRLPAIMDVPECTRILRDSFRYHAISTWVDQEPEPSISATYRHSLLAESGTTALLVTGGIGCKGDPFAEGERVQRLDLGPSRRRGSQDGPWDTAGQLPNRRSGHAIVFVSNQLYVIGGLVHLTSKAISKPTNSVLRYSREVDRWYEVSPMREARAHFAVASIDQHGTIYVFGGESGNFSSTDGCEVYSTETDRWTELPGLSMGRVGASACAQNGLVYVVGGRVEESVLPLVDCFDIESGRWRSCTPLERGVCHGALVEAAGSLFHAGGAHSATDSGAPADYCLSLLSTAAILQYDSMIDQWQEVAQLPSPRHHIGAAAAGSDVFVVGGFSTHTWEYLNQVALFDAKSGRVSGNDVTALPWPVMKAAVTIVGTGD